LRRLGGLFGALLLLVVAAAPAAAAVTGSAQLLGGYVSDQGRGALLIELKNDGRELKGRLLARRTTQPGEPAPVEWSIPLTLPAGGTKQVPLPAAWQMSSGAMKVRFEADGTTLYETEVRLPEKEPGLTLVGLLTDDERGVTGLDGYKVLANQAGAQAGPPQVDARVELSRIQPGHFPADSSQLSVFDAILLYRYQTERLTAPQREALAQWVAAGGTLVVGGGPEWKRTIEPLPAGLLPVQVTGVGTADLGALATLAPGNSSPGSAPVSLATVNRGKVLADAPPGLPLAVEAAYGAGRVLYLAVDPGLAPLASWDGTGPMLASLLHVQPDFGWKEGNYRLQAMTNPLQQIGSLQIPSLGILFGLLALYVLILGPASYWLLKRRDKRELLWLSVPLLAVLGVGGAWIASGGRRSGVLATVITVTELYPGTGMGRLSSYVGLYTPAQERLTVPMPADELLQPINEYGPSSWQGGTINLTDQPTVDFTHLNTYSLTTFALTKDVKLPEGLVLVEAKVQANTLTGRLENHLDQAVTGVRIVVGGALADVGDLAAGAKSEPFSVNLALPGRPNLWPNGMGPGRTPAETTEFRRRMVLDALFSGPDLPMKEQERVRIVGWLERPVVAPGFKGVANVDAGPHLLLEQMLLPEGKGGIR
jgi:hypothetical protein